MRTRRQATIQDLRRAIDCLPRETRVAMLEGIRADRDHRRRLHRSGRDLSDAGRPPCRRPHQLHLVREGVGRIRVPRDPDPARAAGDAPRAARAHRAPRGEPPRRQPCPRPGRGDRRPPRPRSAIARATADPAMPTADPNCEPVRAGRGCASCAATTSTSVRWRCSSQNARRARAVSLRLTRGTDDHRRRPRCRGLAAGQAADPSGRDEGRSGPLLRRDRRR